MIIITNYKMNRSIDDIKVYKFLKKIKNTHPDPELSSFIVKKVIDNTLYITTDEMINNINILIDNFHRDYKEYNLFIPKIKIGSEHLILSEVYKKLHPTQIIYGYDDKIVNNLPILIIDDAIYSNVNICYHVDELMCNNKGQTNIFIALVCLSSNNNNCQFTKHYRGTIYATHYLEDLQIHKLLGEKYDDDYVYDNFGIEATCILPVYFDHKIANNMGSYQFYHQLIKNPIDRSHIDKITWKMIEYIIKYLIKK